jgi:hypothetical protein
MIIRDVMPWNFMHTHQCYVGIMVPVYQQNVVYGNTTSQPTKFTTIQSLITTMRNCEKFVVLRTPLRKQCSKEERCNCAVIKLMFHMWKSLGPYATSDVTLWWLGGQWCFKFPPSKYQQLLTDHTTYPRIHTTSATLLQESQSSNINLTKLLLIY